MNGREHMAQVLGATGIYKLTGDSPVDWELDAYGAGLQVLETAMAELEGELFALTAPSGRLAEWERLFRSQESGAELAVRREAAAKAIGLRPVPATLQAVREEILPIAGIKGTVAAEGSKLTITVEEYQGVTAKEAKRLLDRLLPAHLEWEIAT